METISVRIKKLGSELPRGWQADLARHCKVKPPSVAAWVSGETKKIDGQNLLMIADFFNVNPIWLATGSGRKEANSGILNIATQKSLQVKDIQQEAIEHLSKLDEDDAELWLLTVKLAAKKLRNNEERKEKGSNAQDPPLEPRRTSN